jgi:hypothetical protein
VLEEKDLASGQVFFCAIDSACRARCQCGLHVEILYSRTRDHADSIWHALHIKAIVLLGTPISIMNSASLDRHSPSA